MPEITFYLDQEHWNKYKSLDNEKKKEINAKARELMYKELDKVRKIKTKI